MRALAVAAGLLLLPLPAFAQAPAAGGSGKQLYDKYCSQCHGETGDGKGPAAPHVLPKPRDFTTGKFKIRTTPNGALPTDGDLERIIRRGMPYTSMPAWPQFTDQQVKDLVEHVKSFHDGFKNPELAPKPITFPAPPAAAADSVEKGREIYGRLGCAGCHGEVGRSDGPTATMLKEEQGNPIRPADLTQPWTFRGGATREDIFRTLTTGLNGTPMPSFQDALKDDERWQLTDYILSLAGGSTTPSYQELLVAAVSEDGIDLAKGAALFEKAPTARFPVVGQIMEPGRAFYPGTVSVLVQAVVDDQRIAFRVRWNDIREDATGQNAPDLKVPIEEEAGPAGPGAAAPAGGESADPFADEIATEPAAADPFADEMDTGAAAPAGGAEFSDAVAIQLPASLPGGIAKPYFLFGDGQNAVDLWFMDLAKKRARQYVGRGTDALAMLEGAEVEGTATFDKGEWSAVFVRDLRSTTGVSFLEDQFVPVAFSVWDGTNRERGNRRGLTQWAYVYVPPREKPSPYKAMAGAAVGALVLEAFVVGAMVRRRRRRAPSAQE